MRRIQRTKQLASASTTRDVERALLMTKMKTKKSSFADVVTIDSAW